MKVTILLKKEMVIFDKATREVGWEVSNIDFSNDLFSFVVEPQKALILVPRKNVKYLMIRR